MISSCVSAATSCRDNEWAECRVFLGRGEVELQGDNGLSYVEVTWAADV